MKRGTANSLDNGAHTARTLVQSGRVGTGALDLHGDLFPVGRMIEDERTEAAASYHVATHGGSSSREPVGGGPAVAWAWALLQGLQTSRVGGFRKAAGAEPPPHRAAARAWCFSQSRGFSIRGRRELPSTGRGRARRSSRSLVAAATYAGPEGSVGGSSGGDCLRP